MTDEEVVATIVNARRIGMFKSDYISGVEVFDFLRYYLGPGDADEKGRLKCCTAPREVADALESEGVPKESIQRFEDAEGNSCIVLAMPNQNYWIYCAPIEKIAITVPEDLNKIWYHSCYIENKAILPYYAKDIAKLVILADRVAPLVSEKLAELLLEKAKRKKIREIGRSYALSELPRILRENGYIYFSIDPHREDAHVKVDLGCKKMARFDVKYDVALVDSAKLIATLDSIKNFIRQVETVFEDTLIIEGLPYEGLPKG